MAWIESHQELGRHPKTRKLARQLNISLPAAIGHLHFLWWWALDYAQDGDITRYDADEIAEAALWEGDAQAFFDALVAVGFVTVTLQLRNQQESQCVAIHDWDDYAGRLIEQRKANAAKQKRWRERHKESGNDAAPPSPDNSNRHVTVSKRLRNGATKPNHTEPSMGNSSNNISVLAPNVSTLSPNRETAGAARKSARAGSAMPGSPSVVTNPLWDVLVEVFEEPTTKSERSNFGKVVRELKEIGATPEDVRLRVANHARTCDWDLTLNALMTHWTELGRPPNPSRPRASQNGHAPGPIPATIAFGGD